MILILLFIITIVVIIVVIIVMENSVIEEKRNVVYQSVILLNILIIGFCYITQVNITRLEMEFAYHACTDPLHHRIAVTTQAL